MFTFLVTFLGVIGLLYISFYILGLWWIHRRTTPRDGWKAQERRDREFYKRLNAEYQRGHVAKSWDVELQKTLDKFGVDKDGNAVK